MKKYILLLTVLTLLLSAGCKKQPTKGTAPTDAATQPSQTEAKTNPTEQTSVAEPQEKGTVLAAWTGAFSDENYAAAIRGYLANQNPFTAAAGKQVLTVSFDTEFDVATCSVPVLSPVNTEDRAIDLSVNTEINGRTITVDTGWWYREYGSWVQDYYAWSYLVCAVDMDGTEHYYYFCVDYSGAR